MKPHQSLLAPEANKFHVGNGDDGKHYWLTPPDLFAQLHAEFNFTFDPCPHPYPTPDGFDGLTCEWGKSNYVNPPFGSIMHQGKKKGPTAWVRKAIEEWQKGKRVVLVYPVDKWVLMLVKAIFGEHSRIRNLGDVRWLATEDGSAGKGTGRHIAMFILEPDKKAFPEVESVRDDWCKEYVALRNATPRSTDVARYIAAHFLGADCDRAALKHAEAILALAPSARDDCQAELRKGAEDFLDAMASTLPQKSEGQS